MRKKKKLLMNKMSEEEMRKEIVEKWSGLLDGLSGFTDNQKKNIAKLCESQDSVILNEYPPYSGESFDEYSFPIVRRVIRQMDEQLKKDKDGK